MKPRLVEIKFMVRIMGVIRASLALTLVAFLWCDSLHAQAADKKRRETTINFEDELIQGEVKKPELLYLLQRKQFNFKKLIKLRENFVPEMKRTAEDIQQVGSND